jgi:hypothetical protein
MRRDPKDLVGLVMKRRRSPNVVGAGIGSRHVGGAPTGEPCLTVLVTKKVPVEELRLPASCSDGAGRIVEVLEVGEVVALPRSDRART